MKKLLCILLAVAMCLAVAAPVYADTEEAAWQESEQEELSAAEDSGMPETETDDVTEESMPEEQPAETDEADREDMSETEDSAEAEDSDEEDSAEEILPEEEEQPEQPEEESGQAEASEEPVSEEPDEQTDGAVDKQALKLQAAYLLQYIVGIQRDGEDFDPAPYLDENGRPVISKAAELLETAGTEPVDPGNDPGDDPGDDPGEEPEAKSLAGDSFVDPASGWSEYDDLIDSIRSERDSEARAVLMHEAEDILMASGCVVPIYYYTASYLQKDYVDGVFSTPYAYRYYMYAENSSDPETLRVGMVEPRTLDPAMVSSVGEFCVAVNTYSGLYTYSSSGGTAPACASGYEVSADGLTYTFTLREGLRWSDGSALTAADFAESWKRAAAENTGADYGYLFEMFAGYPDNIEVYAADDQTLVFKLNAYCAYIEDLMTFPVFYPVKSGAEAGYVTNGAFVCTETDSGSSAKLEKNPYWYDADAVSVEKLMLLFYGTGNAFDDYQNGSVDITDCFSSDQASTLIGGTEFHSINQLGTFYLEFNSKSSVFEGKTPEEAACIRQAVSLLIDRGSICDSVGISATAADAIIPHGMSDGNGGVFHSGTSGYFDPYGISNDRDGTIARAVLLLKAAGYEFGEDGKLSAETPLTLSYLMNASLPNLALADQIRDSLAVVGIELTINQAQWADYVRLREEGAGDLIRGGWISDYNDPCSLLELWTSGSPYNYGKLGS